MHKPILLLLTIGLTLLHAASMHAQEPSTPNNPPELESATPTAPAASDEISVAQAQLADRFKRLEEVLGQLAEFSASSDPRRAKLLREAIAQSREQDINVRFESIVKLLEDERLAAASSNQKELQTELETLLNLLLKADRDKELASERDRLRAYLKELGRLLRMQRGIRARTEGGDELRNLSDDQRQVATDTNKLGGNISDNERNKRDSRNTDADREKNKGEDADSSKGHKDGDPSKSADSSKSGEPSDGDSAKSPQSQPGEGQPSDGQPSDSGESQPSQPGQSQGQPGQPSQGSGESGEQPQPSQDPVERAAERLRRAAQQMEDARKKLEEAERKGASDRQREAMRDLEAAKAELERVLRQLREEELERTLTQLAARFKKMLELQNQVYEGTMRLNEVPQAKRDHDDEIEAARLSRMESEIIHEADKALLLLREEGSSVAFPEIVEQMRDDMRTVAERLAEFEVGAITQGLEKDIIAGLEEAIAALEKARKDLEKKRKPRGGESGGQQRDPDLVDKLAELKLIRSLQMRINQRTQRYGEMIEGEQAETEDLLEALQELSERQERVHRAISDLELGVND